MTLIDLIVVLIFVGLLLYLVSLLPLDAIVKRIIHVVTIVLIVLWLIARLFPGALSIRVGG